MTLLTTEQVAEKLGVSRRRVLAMIASVRLPAQRYGHQWLIDSRSLELVRDRKAGRPRKHKELT
jgi:excisionase family DNA binding protein